MKISLVPILGLSLALFVSIRPGQGIDQKKASVASRINEMTRMHAQLKGLNNRRSYLRSRLLQRATPIGKQRDLYEMLNSSLNKLTNLRNERREIENQLVQLIGTNSPKKERLRGRLKAINQELMQLEMDHRKKELNFTKLLRPQLELSELEPELAELENLNRKINQLEYEIRAHELPIGAMLNSSNY